MGTTGESMLHPSLRSDLHKSANPPSVAVGTGYETDWLLGWAEYLL